MTGRCATVLPHSLAYHRSMPRLAALIALVFAFASLAGMTTAHAHRFVATPIVVLNHVDAHNTAIPIVVKVQSGEIDLGAGVIMPCGQLQGIEASVSILPQPRYRSLLRLPRFAATPIDWPAYTPLRPPRAA